MENQEIFNTVVLALREQGVKSAEYDADGELIQCLYRDGDNKCAAGHLIPDEDYHEQMEGTSISTSTMPDVVCDIFQPLAAKLGWTPENIALIHHLQHIHDEHEVEEWEEQWTQLAKNFNLVMV